MTNFKIRVFKVADGAGGATAGFPAHYGVVMAFIRSTEVRTGTPAERALLRSIHIDARQGCEADAGGPDCNEGGPRRTARIVEGDLQGHRRRSAGGSSHRAAASSARVKGGPYAPERPWSGTIVVQAVAAGLKPATITIPVTADPRMLPIAVAHRSARGQE